MAYRNLNKKFWKVNSPDNYRKSCTNTEFSCSKLGSYSIDAQGNFYNDNERELRSLIPNYTKSKIDSDLTAGFDPSVPSDSKLERPLDSLLYWIVLNKEKISSEVHGSSQAKQLDAEFVFAVGTMKNLLGTVFKTGKDKRSWKMYALKYNGTIYISSVEDKNEVVGSTREPSKLGCSNGDDELQKISYMGTKFEELISEPVAREPQGEPADRKVDGRQGFYSVKRGSFGGRHLVLTRAQVDFVEKDEYVECKLSLKYTGGDEWKFPMNKLREWWYHMYAGDMKQVIYGIRDGTRLKQVSRVTQREEIPNKVKHPRKSCPPAIESALRSWDPKASIGFVDEFLQWLKGKVEDGYRMEKGRAVQYVLEWEKGSPLISYTPEEVRTSNFVLLPDWYIGEMSAFFAN